MCHRSASPVLPIPIRSLASSASTGDKVASASAIRSLLPASSSSHRVTRCQGRYSFLEIVTKTSLSDVVLVGSDLSHRCVQFGIRRIDFVQQVADSSVLRWKLIWNTSCMSRLESFIRLSVLVAERFQKKVAITFPLGVVKKVRGFLHLDIPLVMTGMLRDQR